MTTKTYWFVSFGFSVANANTTKRQRCKSLEEVKEFIERIGREFGYGEWCTFIVERTVQELEE